MTIVFPRRRGGQLGITPSAIVVIGKHLQRDGAAPESGGLLLGRRLTDSSDVVIDVATEPHKLDRQSRHRFWRARKPAQERVDQAWRSSGGTENYLGDWHTHPEESPSPSCMDEHNWSRLVRRTQFEGDALFFLIAGTVDYAVWECLRGDWWGAAKIGRCRYHDLPGRHRPT